MSAEVTRTLWRRPAFWLTAVIAVAVYWDPVALRGAFIYDDVASIVNNDVVLLNVPWYEAFTRDFWGTEMIHPASHKSYRPITTITLRWNMILSYLLRTAGTEEHTYHFHLVNVALHGINSGLITETAAIVLGDGSLMAPIIAGICFAIHPVHAEAVSNITSRGELLMTFFFLLAFLSYATHIPAPTTAIDDKEKGSPNKSDKNKNSPSKSDKKGKVKKSDKMDENTESSFRRFFRTLTCFICVYILPFLFMALSLFSKEQGVTTLCTLVAFDFIRNHDNVQSFLSKLRQGNAYALNFLKRTAVLALQTVAMAGIRYWLNGESSPDFVEEQNPPGFAKDRFARVFTVNWVYVLYLRDMVFPAYLAPDWSGDGIPLIESISDQRAWLVIALWLFFFGSVYSLLAGSAPTASKQRKEIRQVVLIAFFAFLFLPFLLSSNLLVTTGLTKADRVIYLPLFGYCLMQGLIFKLVLDNTTTGEDSVCLLLIYAFLTIQFSFFGLKVHERNLAWSSEYTLWTRAYQVNPFSKHTRSNCGRVKAKNKEFIEAEELMRPIKDVRTNGGNPNDTFLYTVSLAKMDRCEESFRLIDDAIAFIHEEREEAGIRYSDKMSFHAESSLVVSRAFCTEDVVEKGRILQEALTIDPNNEFAQHQYQNYLNTVQRMQQEMQMGSPQIEEQIRMMREELQNRGLSEEQIQMFIMQQMAKQQQMQEQLMQMQQQQPQGNPQQQQYEQMMAKQQKMMMQQSRKQATAQQSPRPTPQQNSRTENRPVKPSQGQNIPQNLGMASQSQAMPPIEDFDNGELDDMFFNEGEEDPPVAEHEHEHEHEHEPEKVIPDRKEMPPSARPQPRQRMDSPTQANLGMPPIAEFENGGFEKMFLEK